MKTKTKTEQIYEELKREYGEYSIPNKYLRKFAKELYNYVFEEKGSLVQVMALVDTFEIGLLDDDIEVDISQGWFIFNDIVHMLDANSKNAERLYETFLEFNDFDVFELLMTTYSKWLTEDQKKEIMEIAMGHFDKTLMKRFL